MKQGEKMDYSKLNAAALNKRRRFDPNAHDHQQFQPPLYATAEMTATTLNEEDQTAAEFGRWSADQLRDFIDAKESSHADCGTHAQLLRRAIDAENGITAPHPPPPATTAAAAPPLPPSSSTAAPPPPPPPPPPPGSEFRV